MIYDLWYYINRAIWYITIAMRYVPACILQFTCYIFNRLIVVIKLPCHVVRLLASDWWRSGHVVSYPVQTLYLRTIILLFYG